MEEAYYKSDSSKLIRFLNKFMDIADPLWPYQK